MNSFNYKGVGYVACFHRNPQTCPITLTVKDEPHSALSRTWEKHPCPVENVNPVSFFNNLTALCLFSFACGKAEQGKMGKDI